MQFGHLFAQGPTREAATRAMVVALRDVRVRGEIHTIIDYAADMLQSTEFVNNSIHTGWLDSRIAANVKAERPPWHLCVIGAAAVRAHEAFACKAAEYLGFLAKGQLPPPDISLIYFQVRWAKQPQPHTGPTGGGVGGDGEAQGQGGRGRLVSGKCGQKQASHRVPWVSCGQFTCGDILRQATALQQQQTSTFPVAPPTPCLRQQDDLVIDDIKYHVKVIRRAPHIFNVSVNSSDVDVWARKLGDGGFLLQVCIWLWSGQITNSPGCFVCAGVGAGVLAVLVFVPS